MHAGQQDGTTANEQPRTMASAEAAERLGPLIRNQETTMAYYHLPVRCLCGKHLYRLGIDPGFTHHPDDPCPYPDDEPGWADERCCWFLADLAHVSLILNGYRRLAERMLRDMSCTEAAAFAIELRVASDRLEKAWGGSGLEYDDLWDFEDGLRAIRSAASWYARTASLEFGAYFLEG